MLYKVLVGSILALLVSEAFAAEAPAQDVVNSFEQLFGVTEGKRRNHTKGFCFNATLLPGDNAIQQYTTSSIFRDNSRVVGRLSHKGGNNNARDDKPAEYGIALSIETPSGEKHLMSMNTLDFFPVSTPEAFAELMRAKAHGSEAVKAFKASSSELQRFAAHASKKPKDLVPYEGSVFNSINSFYLVNSNGVKTAVRWSFVPVRPQHVLLAPKPDFFFENMQKNLSEHGIEWDMVITIANEGDQVNDASIAWAGPHKKINAARLVVGSIVKEADGRCDRINFDPLVISSGFEPSEDPLLLARRNAYAVSFGRRLSEKK